MCKRLIPILVLCMICIYKSSAQVVPLQKMQTPAIGVKTNILSDAFTNFNLGAEVKLSGKSTLDLVVDYNPWTFSDNSKFKHILVQPEYRYWLCESFNGHFLGVHGHYAYYNVGGLKLPLDIYPSLEKNRYEGWLLGGGVSYGYQWYISPRWSLEATIGVGYFYTKYDKYDYKKCGDRLGDGHKHYIGPTRLGISFIYLIK